MARFDVIESKVWQRDDGRTASPYGAVPWVTPSEEKRWKLVTRGYTVRDNERGTVGVGRQPWPTRAEAQAWVNKEEARLAEARRAHEARYPKKTPAQLQREIDEALAQKRTKRSKRSHATARSPRSAWPSVVGSHDLGTADARTQEGAYWIVTVPTGYRVDYKPWGPSNEVHLGTFPSRQRARAKINEHAGGTKRRSHTTVGSQAGATAEQINREIAPRLGKTPAQLVRAINAIVRAADGRNVYLISTRLGSQSVRRVVGARAMPGTKGRGLDVRLLDTGVWQGVLPEMGDRIEVR